MTALRPLDLIPVPDAHLDTFGPLAEPWLIEACAYEAEWDLAEIKAGIAAKRFQLWLCWDEKRKACVGAGVTRISVNKRGERIGHDVVFAGEDMGRLLPLLDRLEEFFRARGCARFRISGRKGWARRLPHYRLAAIVLEKVLR
jgi:hypothetical protein